MGDGSKRERGLQPTSEGAAESLSDGVRFGTHYPSPDARYSFLAGIS